MRPLWTCVCTAALFGFATTHTAEANCRLTTDETGHSVAVMDNSYHALPPSSYHIKGASYKTLPASYGFKENGLASWYGRPFHGRRTANGETYNMFEYTAAHPTLPIPSCVRVTNLDNGRSILVRINDRGPYHGNGSSKRVIDLSLKAAMALRFRDKGTANVKVEALPTADNTIQTAQR